MMPRTGREDDRGITLVIASLSMVAILLIVALVIDLGYVRGSANLDQASADFAALAAAEGLSIGDYDGACSDAVDYANTNLDTSFNPVSFCSAMGNTVCTSPSGVAQATPTASSGKYTLTIHFPVPDADIADATFGAGMNDGVPCERMRVTVSSQEPSFFGGIADTSAYRTTRSATVRPFEDDSETVPALWLLDPYGCIVLGIDGGSTSLSVGNPLASPPVRGILTVDSDGSDPACSSTTTTIDSSGTLQATPVSGPLDARGQINLNALDVGANNCVGSTACRQPQIGPNISPAPSSAGGRATRKYVDWAWNCKTGYPSYSPYGVTPVAIEDCPGVADPNIDQLESAIGTSGAPAGFTRWSTVHGNCNVSGNISVTGNWWVDCGGPGLRISTGNSVTFNDGNVIFDGGVRTTGSGRLEINTANPDTSSVPSNCFVPCNATDEAALAFVRGGDIDVNGPVVLRRTSVYLDDSSGLVMSAGANPSWSAPISGPFDGLALWGESETANYQIAGNSDVTLSGTFFTPFGEMVLTGGGNWGQEAAQFISYRLKVSGGSTLTLAPDENIVITFPAKAGVLIR